MSRKNSIYKKIPLKKKIQKKESERKKESSSFKSPKKVCRPLSLGEPGFTSRNSRSAEVGRASANLNRTCSHSNISAECQEQNWLALARLFKSPIPPSFQLFSVHHVSFSFSANPLPSRFRPTTCISGDARNKNARIATLSVLPR